MSTIGAAHDVCPIAGDGKDLEIGFNCRYLLDALRGHRILAAGLDTHNHEPLGAQSPFCQLDNVVLTDHTAYSTAEGVTELKTKAAQNVVDVLEGRTPRYPVNHL